MSSTLMIECLDCGQRMPFSPHTPLCSACGSPWRSAFYDYDALSRQLPSELTQRPFDIWRYRELLPVRNPNPDLSIGEGGTPLIRALNLGMILGHHQIFLKDERQGPTSSFKDRQAAISISTLKEAGITEAVIASTGNVAIAYSAYAARAGIKLWAFLTSQVPASKMREVALYGTQVIKVTGSYDQTRQVAAEFAHQRGLYMDSGARSIATVESMKTIAFETAEQLTAMQRGQVFAGGHLQDFPWETPDWYVQAVSGGMGPLGVCKGFEELQKMGWIKHIPNIAVIQTDGCAPMTQAWRANLVSAPAVLPVTTISTLATGDPGRSYTLLREKVLATGGVFESVSDVESYRALHFLAKMEGLSIESAAGVAVAGLIKLVRSGQITGDQSVVVNVSGHTMPVEQDILGNDSSKSFIVPSKKVAENEEEGLLAALSKVTSDRYSRIAIVDDNPDVRRLIRRILQSQGNYDLLEAENGRDAVQLIQQELPNLVILDLMMPELDGFGVLDELQKDSTTADIPVIVVTAKELTQNEKSRLHGHIQSLMQKGNFLSDDLLEEVRTWIRPE